MQFSKTAAYYHLLEGWCFGASLQATRLAHLDSLALNHGSANVLIVGEGNGRFLEAFVRAYPQATITVIDESEAMLSRARQRLQCSSLSTDRIEFRIADLRDVDLPNQHYDLLVTHFFFANFAQSEVDPMIEALSQALKPQAEWLLGDFVVPAKGWRRVRAKLWLKLLYSFFGWTAGVSVRSLPQPCPSIEALGFDVRGCRSLNGGLLQSRYYARV